MALQLTPVPNFLNNPSPFAYLTAANQQSMQNALNTQQFQQNQTNLANLPAKNAADLAEMQGRAAQENAVAKSSGVNALAAYAQALGSLPPNQWGILSTIAKQLGINAPSIGGGTGTSGNGAITNPGQVSSIANNSLQNSGNLPTLPQTNQQQQNVSSATGGQPLTANPQQVASSGLPGMLPGNPNLSYKANMAVQQATQTEAGKNEEKAYNDSLSAARKNADASQDISNLGNSSIFHYDQSKLTGPVLGNLVADSMDPNSLVPNAAAVAVGKSMGSDLSNEQIAQRNLLGIALDKLQQLSANTGSRATVMGLKTILAQKPSIALTPDAFHTQVGNIVASSDRTGEELPFKLSLQQHADMARMGQDDPAYLQLFTSNGAHDAAKMDRLFQVYQQSLPVQDKNGNPQPWNNNNWQQFTTPGNVTAILNGQSPQIAQPPRPAASPDDYALTLKNALASGKTKDWVDQRLAARNIKVAPNGS